MKKRLSRADAPEYKNRLDPPIQRLFDQLATFTARWLAFPACVLYALTEKQPTAIANFGITEDIVPSLADIGDFESPCVEVIEHELAPDAAIPIYGINSDGVAYRFVAHVAILHGGSIVGVLAVFDTAPREFERPLLLECALLATALIEAHSITFPAEDDESDAVPAAPLISATPSNLLVGIYSINGKCEYISPSCFDLTGYHVDELQSLDLSALVHPEDVEKVREETQNKVRAGSATVVTYRARRRDGMYRWMETLSTPLRDSNGIVSKFMAFTQDVTPRMLVEQHLIESQQRYRSLFDYSLDPVFCLDLQGRFQTANHAYESLFGCNVEELHTQLFLSYVDVADREIIENIFEMTTHGESLAFEVVMLDRAGRRVPTSGLSVPIIIANKVVGIYCILRDKSVQKRAEALMREESEVLAMIATGVPLHDILVRIATAVDTLCAGATTAIMRLDRDLPQFHCICGSAFPVDLVSLLDHIPLDSRLAACGAALTSNERIVTDIVTDSVWEPFKEALSAIGYCSCWSSPIGSAHKSALGTIDIYFKSYRAMCPDDVELISQAVNLARIAIEREQGDMALKESEGRFRQLIENGSDIITIMDNDGTIRYASPSTQRILGYSAQDVVNSNVFAIIHPDDIASVKSAIQQCLARPGTPISAAFRARHNDASWKHIEAIGTNMLNTAGIRGIVVNSRDITARKRAEEQLDHMAYHDVLTELPNRLLYNNRLHRAIEQARRNGKMVGVLFLDINRFKIINDTLGHALGDVLLRSVSSRLAKIIRPQDTVARWGGDEFTFVLPDLVRTMEAIRLADSIVNALSEPFRVHGHELYISANVGISLFPNAGEDVVALVRNADIAMYRAKERGANFYQVYTANMNEETGERFTFETSLRKSIERGEFLLQYQPQVEVSSGLTTGAEALLRWKHPEFGLIPPSNFIPLAEETGLIVQIGEWVIQTACEQAKSWLDAGYGPLLISVNLSAKQLRDSELLPRVREILAQTHMDPSCLEIELTESMFIDGKVQNLKALMDLREMGVKLAIDDFGTGYSSFLYLKNYPVDTLKIDRSFVRNLAPDTSDSAITQSIISMAKSLKLRTVAEGVETKQQYDILVEQGCEVIQGYYFSAPLSPPAFTNTLNKPVQRLRGSPRR